MIRPDDRTVSHARQPVALVLLDGQPVQWMEWSNGQTSNFTADTFNISLPIKLLPAAYGVPYWATADGAEIEIRAGFAEGPDANATLESLIIGEVDDVEHDLQHRVLHLTGRDYSARFIEAKTTEKFQNQTSSQIAETLAARRGLQASVTATSTMVGRYYEIDHARLTCEQTEWDLLTFLAQQEGYEVWVKGKTLFFQPPPDPTTPTYEIDWHEPTDQDMASGTAGNLKFVRNLTIAKDVIVKVHSWNQKQQAGFTKTYKALRAQKSQRRGGEAQEYSYTIPNLTPEQALQEAQRRAHDITKHELIFSGSLPGDNLLTPRSVVRLRGVGSWEGIYHPESVNRRFSLTDGYRMDVRAKNHPTRSTVGL